ncbi:MAG: outer membrane lipoprotein carrier protein LolA [Phycisphaerae bacterium]|nr:outer membrane lipoprotein carrier protein LolA [Phycisphaerae bacterium]
MYRLMIIAALGIGLGTGLSRGDQAPSANPVPQTVPDPNALDRVLKNLQDKTVGLRSYQVNMDYLFQQPLLESQQRRTGVLYYAKSDKKSDLRIDFRTLRQDEEKEQKYEQQYLFDGVWLWEVDQQLQTATKRQLAEPNKPLDALSLASKQVPVLGFSQVDDLRKQFEIELVADPPGPSAPRPHLHLTVKPDSVYKDDYVTIDLWIDGKIGLPVQVKAVTAEDDVYEIKLTDPKVNAELDPKLFEAVVPRSFSMEVIPLAKRAEAAGSPTR